MDEGDIERALQQRSEKTFLDLASESDGQVEFTWLLSRKRKSDFGHHFKDGEIHVSMPWYALAVGGVAALASLWFLLKMLSDARDDAAVTAELIKASIPEGITTEVTDEGYIKTVHVDDTVIMPSAALYTYTSGATLVLVTATGRGVTKRSMAVQPTVGDLRRPTGREKREAIEVGGVDWDALTA